MILKKTTSALIGLLILSMAWAQENVNDKLLESAKTYYKGGEYRKALNLLDKFVINDSSNADVFQMRGNCFLEINHTEKAISDYRTAISLDPFLANAYYNLASTYDYADQQDSAMVYFKKYTALQPGDADAWERIGMIMIDAEAYDSVGYYLEKAFSLDSASEVALHYLVQNKFYNGDYAEARKLAHAAQQVDSANADFYLFEGMSDLMLWRFEEAEQIAEKVLALDSMSVDGMNLWLQAAMLKLTDTSEWMHLGGEGFRLVNYTQQKLQENLAQLQQSDFDSLKNRLISGQLLSLDGMQQFYLMQSQQSGYSPYGLQRNEKLSEKYNKEDYEGVVKLSEGLFDTQPLILSDFYKVALAHYVLGNMQEFKKYYAVYFGMIESIIATGDGQSAATAYVVTTTSDEYELLYYLGLQTQAQSLVHEDGHSYDVLKALDEEQNEHDVYFNIDMPFRSLRAVMADKELKPSKKKRKKKR